MRAAGRGRGSAFRSHSPTVQQRAGRRGCLTIRGGRGRAARAPVIVASLGAGETPAHPGTVCVLEPFQRARNMEIENLFRYPPLAVGLKPSAIQGEARLRGL